MLQFCKSPRRIQLAMHFGNALTHLISFIHMLTVYSQHFGPMSYRDAADDCAAHSVDLDQDEDSDADASSRLDSGRNNNPEDGGGEYEEEGGGENDDSEDEGGAVDCNDSDSSENDEEDESDSHRDEDECEDGGVDGALGREDGEKDGEAVAECGGIDALCDRDEMLGVDDACLLADSEEMGGIHGTSGVALKDHLQVCHRPSTEQVSGALTISL